MAAGSQSKLTPWFMIDATEHPAPRRVCWRCIGLCYAFLALFAFASVRVPQMNALWLGIATLALSLPAMLALWHHVTVRRLAALHQFRLGRGLYRWGSRRALAILLRAALAIVVSGVVLLQSAFFGPVEWVLLALSPAIYLVAQAVIETGSAPQFSQRAYSRRWVFWMAQVTVVTVLTVSWLVARYLLSDAPSLPLVERVHELQSGWAQAPSGIVVWALDAGAWGAASIEALGRWPDDRLWRSLLPLVFAPVSVFGFAALSWTGLSLPLSELRRVFGERLDAGDDPPPVGALRAAVWGAVAAVCAMAIFQMLGAVETRLAPRDSPLAVARIPECERIGVAVYKLNTLAALTSHSEGLKERMGGIQRAACEQLAGVETLAEKGVDGYLDWYFSLGAEWFRLATMLTGDIDFLLQYRFSQMVFANPELERRLAGAQADYERLWGQVIAGQEAARELLERNRLVLDESQCRVVNEFAVNPLPQQTDAFRTRLLAGSGAGLVAGAFAAKATAKAMGKASMKSASKVLSKVAAKKVLGKAGAAAAGSAAGAAAGSVVPGPGTATGAAIGALLGLAIGTGVDIAMLAAEEKLTRGDMKKDLLAAVSESLQPYREMFECGK
ncbi:MAG: hypothetical protein IT521_06180 [Burkholderiales bacterium]|nr:hypothetical protein [Burkholderiales bacterium]